MPFGGISTSQSMSNSFVAARTPAAAVFQKGSTPLVTKAIFFRAALATALPAPVSAGFSQAVWKESKANVRTTGNALVNCMPEFFSGNEGNWLLVCKDQAQAALVRPGPML